MQILEGPHGSGGRIDDQITDQPPENQISKDVPPIDIPFDLGRMRGIAVRLEGDGIRFTYLF